MKNEYFDLIIKHLQGNLDTTRSKLFYSWVNENAANKKLFFEIKAIYDACSPSQTAININESWNRLLHKKMESSAPSYGLWNRISTYAAVALVAIAITSAYFIYQPRDTMNLSSRYIGGDGLNADIIELPDGTLVSLGSKTTFYYDNDFGKGKRIVYLEGEAYFDVAKQKSKPFIVKTRGQDIEALGTKFNVMAYPSDSLLIATLLEGSVKLTTDNTAKSTILKPNEQSIYNRNIKTTTLRQVDASQFISWTSGYYYFPEQSMKAILDRLSHVYGLQFTVNSEVLNNRKFTGTFYRGQSIKNIMEIINLSIPIKYKIEEQRVSISAI